MEFRLNKIDTDLRRKMKAKTKGGKVNKFAEVSIEPDVKRALKNKDENQKNKMRKNKKRFVMVDSVKAGDEIKVDAELKAEQGQASRGVFLDTRK
ncbi:MAG: hypothetical protein ACRC2K_09390 [Clostridium sp.]